MAKWKKVIVSGSSAELTHVTASHGIQITNIADTSDNTENVLVVDASGNVKKATQATVAGAISQAHAYATTSIDNTSTSQFTSVGTILSASVNSNITYVNNGNIALSVSASTDGDFLGIQAVTASLEAGGNIELSGTLPNNIISAVTKSLAAGTNISLSSTGATTTITAVTKSIVAGDNVTISNSAASATINAATSSVEGEGNISVSQVGNVFTVSSTATTAGEDANFTDITASGNISASNESGNHYFGGTATFNTISASKLNIENLTELNTDTVINGGLVFNGFELFEDQIVIRTGSTQFGAGATSSLQGAVTHQFTGSVFITGSNLTLTDGTVTAAAFSGDGAGITGIVASAVTLNTLTAGDGIAASNGNYDGSANTTFSVGVGTGLEIDSDAVKISDGGVGATQLAAGVAGTGLAGGAGTALSVDLNELTEAVISPANDSIVFIDSDSNVTRKDTIADLATQQAGAGLDASNGGFKVAIDEVIHGGLSPDSGISSSIEDGIQKLELGIQTLPEYNAITKEDYIALYDHSEQKNVKTTLLNAVGDIFGTGFTVGSDDITLDPGTALGESSVENSMLVNDELTIGTTTIALGATVNGLTGLQDLDLTNASHTIFATVGSNTLEIGAAATTVDIPGDLVVDGNFTVQGTVTTINTETLTIDDNFIDLNSNFSGSSVGAPSQDAGLSVKRGNLADANLYWDEGKQRWSTSHTNLAGTATDAAVAAYLATAVSDTSNPSTAPVDGVDAAAKVGQLHVNTNTEEIWIYA